MKKIIYLVILLNIFSCITKNTVEETTTSTTTTTTTTTVIIFKKIFKYDIPEDMEESPYEAKYYNYDTLLKEKYTNIFDSNILIAIRCIKNKYNITLNEFVQTDQTLLKSSIKINDFDIWNTKLLSKDIEYLSYQFSYHYNKTNIYQRSIYLKCEDTFYIISLSSKNKQFVLNNKNDKFWQSIRIEKIPINEEVVNAKQ